MRPHPCEHGAPQKNLRHDRQEPHQRAEPEVAAINQPLFDADAKNRPPGLNAGNHGGSRAEGRGQEPDSGFGSSASTKDTKANSPTQRLTTRWRSAPAPRRPLRSNHCRCRPPRVAEVGPPDRVIGRRNRSRRRIVRQSRRSDSDSLRHNDVVGRIDDAIVVVVAVHAWREATCQPISFNAAASSAVNFFRVPSKHIWIHRGFLRRRRAIDNARLYR